MRLTWLVVAEYVVSLRGLALQQLPQTPFPILLLCTAHLLAVCCVALAGVAVQSCKHREPLIEGSDSKARRCFCTTHSSLCQNCNQTMDAAYALAQLTGYQRIDKDYTMQAGLGRSYNARVLEKLRRKRLSTEVLERKLACRYQSLAYLALAFDTLKDSF